MLDNHNLTRLDSVDERTIFLMNNEKFVKVVGKDLGITANDEDDFCQTVLLRSLMTNCNYDPELSSIRTYAKNFIRLQARAWRKERKKPITKDHFQIRKQSQDNRTIGSIWESFEIHILKSGRKLTPRQHEVFTHLRNGLKKVEIASILGISKQAVGNHAKLIRKKIEKNKIFKRK